MTPRSAQMSAMTSATVLARVDRSGRDRARGEFLDRRPGSGSARLALKRKNDSARRRVHGEPKEAALT